jgi:hypothetical protein
VVPKVIEGRGQRSCVGGRGPSTVDVAAAADRTPRAAVTAQSCCIQAPDLGAVRADVWLIANARSMRSTCRAAGCTCIWVRGGRASRTLASPAWWSPPRSPGASRYDLLHSLRASSADSMGRAGPYCLGGGCFSSLLVSVPFMVDVPLSGLSPILLSSRQLVQPLQEPPQLRGSRETIVAAEPSSCTPGDYSQMPQP